MTTQAENDRLCRVGPNTPMGNVMRRYWTPACLSSQLPGPDSDPVSVRLFGQDFIAFRDSNGKVGVLNEYCMHRGVSLLTGRVADGGIRCLYHGWKYCVDGTIAETPNLPDPRFRERQKAPAYPVREAGGIVWTYLGPAEKEPPFRHFAFMDAKESHRTIFRIDQHANYLQLVEQGSDSSHVGVLHSNTARPTWMTGDFTKNPDLLNPAADLGHDLAPSLEIENTEFGMHYAAFRKHPENVAGKRQVRVYPYVMPTIRFIPSPKTMSTVFEIPMDDEHTSTYIVVEGVEPLNRPYLAKMLGLDDPKFWNEKTFKFTAPKSERFYQDRERMRNDWSGYPGIAIEDAIMAVTAGPIADRTMEHLVPADAAVVRIRRLLLESAQRVEKGGDPIGTDYKDVSALAAPTVEIKDGDRWQDLVPQHVRPAQAAE